MPLAIYKCRDGGSELHGNRGRAQDVHFAGVDHAEVGTWSQGAAAASWSRQHLAAMFYGAGHKVHLVLSTK